MDMKQPPPHSASGSRPIFRERLEARYGSPPDRAAAAREMTPAPGWAPLVEIALRAMWTTASPVDLSFGVKDKYGKLVFEQLRVTDELYTLLDQLEHLSASLCDVCGAPAAATETHGWIRTLCPSHRVTIEQAGEAFRAIYDEGYAALTP